MSERRLKFTIQVDKMDKNVWSLGACITHDRDETYLFLALIKWSIAIGMLRVYED